MMATCGGCTSSLCRDSTYAPGHADSVYGCIVFAGVGVCALVACYMQEHEAYVRLPVAVTAAFVTVGFALWLLLFSLYVMVYSVVRRAWRVTRTRAAAAVWAAGALGDGDGVPEYDEEMVRLMDVIDAKKHDQPAPADPPTGHDPALSRGAQILKLRKDLAVNIYLVAVGVFSSVFAVCMLHQRAVECFAVSLLVVGVSDFRKRCMHAPVCHDPASDTLRVHRTLQWLEAGSLFVLFALLSVLCTRADSGVAVLDGGDDGWATPVLMLASAGAPLLLWCAPTSNHNLITLESATPVSVLIAVVLLFLVSPVEPYVRAASAVPHSWLVFLVVPLTTPVTILGLLHLLQHRLAVLPAFGLVFWGAIFALVHHSMPQYATLVPAMALSAVGALAAWRAYGARHVQDHAVAVSLSVPYLGRGHTDDEPGDGEVPADAEKARA